MREIKLRAWDKIHKQMIYSPMAVCSGAWVLFTAEVEGMDCNKAIYPIQQYEIMEYIGRLDHHDKEMCEGDIIEYIENTSRGLVKKITIIRDIRYLPDFSCSKWEEIIGNIYENPEFEQVSTWQEW